MLKVIMWIASIFLRNCKSC